MFATFNGLPEDANYKPYDYNGHWTNRLIRATAQRAMASLLYKDAMRGKVNLIYMDPPYNISFRSNFQANAQNPESAEDWDSLPDDGPAIKAFRDTYQGRGSFLPRRTARAVRIGARATGRQWKFHPTDRPGQRS